MDLKRVWDKFTDKYSNLFIHPQCFIKGYTNTAVRYASKYSKGVLLDIGCGRMPYRKILLPMVKRYIGLDSPKTSRYYHGEIKPDIYADATKIPLKDASCDTILLLQVLEHLPDPNSVIKEISRLLKGGGYLILSTIQSYPLHDEPYDFYRFTKYGLGHLLRQNGLKITKMREQGNVFVLSLESINIYLMFILKKLSQKGMGKFLALLLASLFLVTTTIINILTYPLTFLDKNSKFKIILTLVAKK